MERIEKAANQIAEQIERWFFKYHKKEKSGFNGSEIFTIFHHLYYEKQNELIRRMNLNKHEIPVVALSSNKNEFIIITTERFIRIYDSGTESLLYSNFEGHVGYKSMAAGQRERSKLMSVKTEGYVSEFGLKRKDGQIIYWVIPTGGPGFAFWNVTDKCALIGRKYLIKDYK